MPQYLKRIIVSFWVIAAIVVVMYFVYRSDDAILKLVVILGGCAALFIFIKSYLFKS